MATRDPQTQDERIKQAETELRLAIKLGDSEEKVQQLLATLISLREQREVTREEDQEP